MINKLFLCIALGGLLPGCVLLPMPFTSDRSPQFKGTILNQRTKRPIADAKVAVRGQRRPVFTNVDGHFLLKPPQNFHILLYANLSWGFGWPVGTRTDVLNVSASGYTPLSLDFSDYRIRRSWVLETKITGARGPFSHQYLTLKPLMLTPRQPPAPSPGVVRTALISGQPSPNKVPRTTFPPR